ncbi:MAG: dienelactone hydrolase family protein [Caulobacteraceae bacterium]|nr:dienelactone hydrolase family protein [Caulobacteraceae bacterium]
MPDDAQRVLDASQEVIRLWPDGPPSVIEGVGPEAAYTAAAGVAAGTTMLRNVTEATLTVFRPKAGKANGVGVVVCPGGGWRILAWQHEGIDLAHWLAERGYTAFLLKYRLRGTPADPAEFAARMAALDGRIASPLAAKDAPRAFGQLDSSEAHLQAREVAADDGRRALAVVRERAAEFGLAPGTLGMIGFSAGAFLVADVAMEPGGPDFVAPIYGGETRGRPVPAEAPPLFTVIAQDDRYLFKIVEQLYADWSNADRPAELHIFARGAHGFGMVRQGLPCDRWIDLFEAWMADQGFA